MLEYDIERWKLEMSTMEQYDYLDLSNEIKKWIDSGEKTIYEFYKVN